MEHAPRTFRRRDARALAFGFASGLSAPFLLFSGAFQLSSRKISTLNETWRDAGQFIRTSAGRYKRGDRPAG